MKRRILILFLIVVACISFASVFAKAAGIPVVISSDYSYLIANLGNKEPGTAYTWTVDGKVAKKGIVEETFFLAADGNLKSSSGLKPTSTKGVSYVSGRFGKAFVSPDDGVSFSAKDALDLRQGTIEFWVSPLKSGSSSEYKQIRIFLSYKASNGDELVIWQVENGIICVAQWINGVYMSAYSGLGNMHGWKAKSWHHIAYTYSEKQNFMRLYLDGKPVADTNEGMYKVPRVAATTFTLGNLHYAMDTVRFTREVYDAKRAMAEASRRSAPNTCEVIFPLDGIKNGAKIEVKSGKTSGSFKYLGPPLMDLQPGSTLLPPGTTKLEVRVNTPTAAKVRWSFSKDTPFEKMTPFDKGSGKKVHSTIISGLSTDPSTTKSIYLRSSEAVDYQLEFKYRCVPAPKADYPRISNLWSWRLLEEGNAEYLSKLQLAVLGYADSESLRLIRAVNPDILLFATLQPLEYFHGEPPIPDDYFLKDVSGERITLWPGSYRLNLTKPEVVEFNVKRLQQAMLDADLLFDGAFIDSFIVELSIYKTDSYGKPIRIDADEDGVEDDPATMNAAWQSGLEEMVRLWRKAMPGAYATGHLSKEADELGTLFDGDNLGFICVDTIAGRSNFGYAWARYHDWSKDRPGPNITVIDTGALNELGYGYGVYSSFQEAEQKIPHDVLEFARTWYPTVRYGLAFALMGDGLYEHHFSDVLYCEEWWYDEFDFRLGAPLGTYYNATTVGSETSSPQPLINDGDFESEELDWQLINDSEVDAKLSYVNNAVSGQRAARIDIKTLPKTFEYHYVNFFKNIQVQKGVSYRISFSAKASTPRKIAACLQHRGGDWKVLGFWKEISLGKNWQRYESIFTATDDCTEAGLQFFLASSLGSVYIDDVRLEKLPVDVYQRDFENGTVLLNGTAERQTVVLGKRYSRIVGNQAPRWHYILDDDGDVQYIGKWKTAHHDTPEWQPDPPFYHDWGSTCHESSDKNASALYDLAIPEDGTYTFKVWLPDAPNRAKRTKAAVYEIVNKGKVIATTKLDQTKSPDSLQVIATVKLKAGDKPQLRLRNEGSGILYADAVYVESKARYNDGSPALEVTLEPFDGIILKRTK